MRRERHRIPEGHKFPLQSLVASSAAKCGAGVRAFAACAAATTRLLVNFLAASDFFAVLSSCARLPSHLSCPSSCVDQRREGKERRTQIDGSSGCITQERGGAKDVVAVATRLLLLLREMRRLCG